MKNGVFTPVWAELGCERGEGEQGSEQQKAEPADQAAEVVADGGEDGVDGVAACMGEVIAAHAVVVLEMADYRLDRRAAP